MTTRVAPWDEGRDAYLSGLTHLPSPDAQSALIFEISYMQRDLDELDAEFKASVLKHMASRDEDPNKGLLTMVLHVKGSSTNGTEVSLVRCGAGGELKDKWIVKVGAKMLTTGGQDIPYKSWLHSRASIRKLIEHTFDGGLAMARKAVIRR